MFEKCFPQNLFIFYSLFLKRLKYDTLIKKWIKKLLYYFHQCETDQTSHFFFFFFLKNEGIYLFYIFQDDRISPLSFLINDFCGIPGKKYSFYFYLWKVFLNSSFYLCVIKISYNCPMNNFEGLYVRFRRKSIS